MRAWLATVLAVACFAGGSGSAQVEIDKTLQHVYGTAIMASDVRQARLLRLLPKAADSDEAVLTALENRLLILRELSRQPSVPAATAIAARRQTWTASWPPGTDLPALMTRAAMTDQALDGWFRDDLKIASYLDQRFGQQADDARAQKIAAWVADLRRRANITGRRP